MAFASRPAFGTCYLNTTKLISHPKLGSDPTDTVAMTWTKIVWFDLDQWIGSEIIFGAPRPKWRLDEKLNEAANYEEEYMVKQGILDSEARGVFRCTNVHDESQQAIMKIRMQFVSLFPRYPYHADIRLNYSLRIPYFETAFKTRRQRAVQANSDMRFATKREIEALEYLTTVGCSATPALLASKHETQGEDDWVPGGFLDYILMEKLPGVECPYWSGCMDRLERDQLRAAFKEAWL